VGVDRPRTVRHDFQAHTLRIEFRKIEIKELPSIDAAN